MRAAGTLTDLRAEQLEVVSGNLRLACRLKSTFIKDHAGAAAERLKDYFDLAALRDPGGDQRTAREWMHESRYAELVVTRDMLGSEECDCDRRIGEPHDEE